MLLALPLTLHATSFVPFGCYCLFSFLFLLFFPFTPFSSNSGDDTANENAHTNTTTPQCSQCPILYLENLKWSIFMMGYVFVVLRILSFSLHTQKFALQLLTLVMLLFWQTLLCVSMLCICRNGHLCNAIHVKSSFIFVHHFLSKSTLTGWDGTYSVFEYEIQSIVKIFNLIWFNRIKWH